MASLIQFEAVMTFKEIAEELRIPVGEVMRANRRALAKLRYGKHRWEAFRQAVLAQRAFHARRVWMTEPGHSLRRRKLSA